MRNIYIIIFLVLSFNKFAATQSISVSWLKNSIGSDWATVNDIALLKDSSVFLIGNYSDTIELHHKKNYGYKDGYIAKYDVDGNCVWTKFIKNLDYCYLEKIVASEKGCLYVSGYYHGTLSLDKQILNSTKKKTAFIACIQSDGNVKWAISIVGDQIEEVYLVPTSKEHLFFATNFSDNIAVNETNYNSGCYSDILLGSINDNGKVLKTTTLNGKGKDKMADMVIDDKNYVYLTGSFEDELHIREKQIKSKGLSDIFFIKLDEELFPQIVWSNGGKYNDFGKTISIDSSNRIILSGNFSGKWAIDIDENIESTGMLDVFVCQLNKNGELVWIDTFGGEANDFVSSVAINSFNDLFISGTYRGVIKKNNSNIRSIEFTSDVFLAKYNSLGEIKFIESFGEKNHDFSKKLLVNKYNDIFLAGNFNSIFRMNDDTSHLATKWEYFLSKLYDCDRSKKISLPYDTASCNESITLIADSSFKSYFWNDIPGNNAYVVDSTRLVKLEVSDEYGCRSQDSIAVKIFKLPEVNLGNDTILNNGGIFLLDAGNDYTKYRWNTFDTTSLISVNTSDLIDGSYLFSVSVLDTNLCGNNDSINITILSPSNSPLSNAQVFPNPFKDFIWLKINNIEEPSRINLQIISTDGAIQQDEEFFIENNVLEKMVNTSFLVPGEYYLRISSKSINEVFKILKN